MRPKFTPRRACLLFAFIAAVLALAACGGGDDDASTATQPPSTPAATSSTPASSAAPVPAETPTANATPDESASDAAEHWFDQLVKGQSGRAWETLHPAHQAIVTKEQFIDCRQDESFPLTDVKAIEEYDEMIDIPRVGSTPTRAVTVEYTLGETVDHITVHLVNVDGAWRWIMSEDDLAAYEAGTCPQ